MELKKINDHMTYDFTEHVGEVNTQPSKTIPDQSLSVREIMERYARGLPLEGRVPVFDEENDMPDLSKMDLAERQEYREQVAMELQEIKERLTKNQKEVEDIKRLKADSEELKKLKEAANKVVPLEVKEVKAEPEA